MERLQAKQSISDEFFIAGNTDLLKCITNKKSVSTISSLTLATLKSKDSFNSLSNTNLKIVSNYNRSPSVPINKTSLNSALLNTFCQDDVNTKKLEDIKLTNDILNKNNIEILTKENSTVVCFFIF